MATGTITGRLKCTEVSGTTTASGALLLPVALQTRPLVDFYTLEEPSMNIWRRDSSYLTCYSNYGAEPIANTQVRIRVWYL